ncbi:hypothetical protein BSYN_24290 [Bacteroides sedimenti]|uniref:DUF3592 domain-containing protein n=1 Tax=Bacteroides sedimenti TaxID=2136147 RepID=A0ABN6ZDM0_9BACE
MGVRLFFRVIFILFTLYSTVKYIEYERVKHSEKPIKYSYIETDYHRGGRGGYYQMKVRYCQREYSVNISEEVSNQIKFKRMPNLYFSNLTNSVFSLWDIKRALRIYIMFTTLFAITFIPTNILYKLK